MSSSRRGEHGPGTALGTALGTQGTAGGTWSGAGVNIQTGAHGAQDGCSCSSRAVVLGGSPLDQLHTAVRGEKGKAYFF